jgi:hypothetical protein
VFAKPCCSTRIIFGIGVEAAGASRRVASHAAC